MKDDTIYEPRKYAAEEKLYLSSILSHNDQINSKKNVYIEKGINAALLDLSKALGSFSHSKLLQN